MTAIVLKDVWAAHRTRGTVTPILSGATLDFPGGQAVALLGRNGAGKSSLLRLVAGTVRPDAGEIRRFGRVSWPVGLTGGFHGDLTGAQNVRFIARAYGVDARALVDFVGHFSELGRHMHLPFRGYSSGMRARLGFAASMGVPFDTYLVDEVTSVGDAGFRERSEAMLKDRLSRAGAIIVSHSLQHLARLCTAGVVIDQGRLTWHDDVMAAVDHHRALMGIAPRAAAQGKGKPVASAARLQLR
ncbi:MAG: ABC transporter ATP-binding protein [Pseudomonadota bacterium]